VVGPTSTRVVFVRRFVLSIYFVFGDDFAPALQEQKETCSQLTSADGNNNELSVYDERPRARDVCARSLV